MLEQALERARAGRQDAERQLFEFLSIPSVSATPEHGADVRRAGGWVADRLRGMGMEVEVKDLEGGFHPVVIAEWMGRPGAPVLGIYGHYDVQPPDPLEDWVSPPFEPAVRDGFVYARGSTDNKGQFLAGLKAVEHAFAAGGPPVNLRFFVEGEEEISGPSLGAYLAANASRLATDYLLLADGLFTAPGLPNLITGLRGLVYTEVEVRGAAADLHSGIYGGAAPNPFNTLAHIIAELKGRDGRVTVPGFYDDVRDPDPAELESWRSVPVTEERLLAETGAMALEGEPGYPVLQRLWARPTLDVHGVIGGFTGEGSKTVIPAWARAKISMRLVPDQDPERVFEAFAAHVEKLATPGTEVSVKLLNSAKPVRCGTDHAGVAAARRAFVAAFGAEPVLVREGGSVPVAIDFQESLHPNLLVTGFGLPGDGLHSPNEHFSLDQYHRGTEMVLHLMDELSRD